MKINPQQFNINLIQTFIGPN